MAAEFLIDLPSGSLKLDPTTPPEHEDHAGANGFLIIDWFDDTIEEFLIGQIKMPPDINGAGTVTFAADCQASVADGNETQLCLYHSAKNSGEDWDAAFASVKSGDFVTDPDQDEWDFITWTATVAALGWADKDQIRIELSRCAIDGGTHVVGDYGISYFRIYIPTV